MRQALKLVPRPEEQFIERYDRLHAWALALTSGNEDRADDLVHDAFIQFTLRRTELGSIQNTDGYLHRMLRNMFLSQMRRSANLLQLPETLADYDSAELGLRILDPQTQMQIADELRRICRYGTERKETSKAGSVLILRFFHGYYLNEIAQVLCSPMDSIYSFLKIARREVKLFLDDPDSMRFVVDAPAAEAADSERNPIRLLTELRNAVFNSRRGSCLEREGLESFYDAQAAAAPDCADVAHIVSCPVCLDEVNQMLDLPLLVERYPTDTLGQSDQPRKDGGDGGDDGGSGDGGPTATTSDTLKRKHSRRFKDVFDHRPQELRVSVNGFVLGAQKVGQEINEQTVSVNIDERIGFVEVFSEQGVRLLFCDVDEPVDGDVEQRAEASLSDGRKLQLTLDFRSAWPSLHVLYCDPVLKSAESIQRETIASDAKIQRDESRAQNIQWRGHQLAESLRRLLELWRFVSGGDFWLKPATVTALVALIVVAAVLLSQFRRGPVLPVSASSLLAQAAAAEQAMAARTDQVIHRTVNLEERKVAQTSVCDACSGELIARRKIEIWQSAEKGITARRLYDDKGHLVAGDWRRQDGVQTLYSHGVKPQLQIQNPPHSIRNSDVWQLDPSAKDFTPLVGSIDEARVEERANDYVIMFDRQNSASSVSSSATSVVLTATLVLSKTDLHATEMTLLLRQGDETREYRMMEASFERRAPSTVAPKVFEPEPELLSADTGTRRLGDTEIPASLRPPVPASPVTATADLEVEVLRLLNSAGADLGEQVSVSRTSEGELKVQGLVETDQRKTEILRALSPLAGNPAIKIDVSTFTEALARQRQGRAAKTPSGLISTERVETAGDVFPAYSDLRGRFSDEESRRYATTMVHRSHEAMRRAWALKRLLQQFSSDDLRTLSPEARAKWLALIRGHAAAFGRESGQLRQQLAPIFFPGGASDDGISEGAIASDADLLRAVERLIAVASANDQAVTTAFTTSTSTSAVSAIKTTQFFRSLKSAEKLAQQIANSSKQ